jgi:hypothetical protein
MSSLKWEEGWLLLPIIMVLPVALVIGICTIFWWIRDISTKTNLNVWIEVGRFLWFIGVLFMLLQDFSSILIGITLISIGWISSYIFRKKSLPNNERDS